tara:strand:- start:190 stop:522 length:333 start_codon:yes stop_codon:yes gene_type:complete
MSQADSQTIKITPKLILLFLVSVIAPISSGVWLIADLSSRLSSLEDSVANIPSSDNSAIVERITAVEMTTGNNKDLLDKANADIDKLVEHVNSSMKQITDKMNSNPLANN